MNVSILFIAGVSFAATLLSSMSGGGSSMVTVPTWLFLGFPLPVAMATTMLSGTAWTLIAARNYLLGHKIDRRLLFGLIGFGLVGAYTATRVIITQDAKILKQVIGYLILGLVALVYIRRDFGLVSAEPRLSKIWTSLAGLPLGFYEAFFGSGNGLFTATYLSTARGFDLLQALGYYYIMAFVWCSFASLLYISGGYWNLSLMLPAVVGSVLGAQLGSRIGRRRGATFVKRIFIAIGGILGLKLALGF